MKKVSIINIKTNQSFGAELEDPTEWINNCIVNNYWGLPERWVRAKELMENGNPEEPEHWMWHSEYYEDSDVLETKEEFYNSGVVNQNEDGTFTSEKSSQTWVKLKADYTIEIIDLEQDYDWLLNECHRKRQLEYPPITELGDALYWKEQGNDSKYIEYIGKCDEVKRKYPKPIRSNT